MKTELSNGETILSGSWVSRSGAIEADEVSKRIEKLTQSVLKEVATSEDGWESLYVDPSDGRYWELTYEESDSHGGGAPTLRHLIKSEADNKYTI